MSGTRPGFIEDPIFIVGTERSGSNLLRLILDSHDSIAIPHPPHLMRDLTPLVGRYGDLGRDENFRRLVHDAIRLVELHFAPWGIPLDAERIFNQAPGRDLYCVYAGIYEQYLASRGKRRWGCKSTFMIRHVAEILRYHKRAKLIHLVRDGRDVAVSARDSVFNHFHPHYVAELWSAEQRVARDWQARLPTETWHTLRYEDLIQRPERAVQDLCSFLGETYNARLLKFFETQTATHLAALSASWQNVARPVMSDNSGKFRKALSKSEIFEFERVAWRELEHYGYKLDNDSKVLASSLPSAARRLEYFLLEKQRSASVQLHALLTDRNAFKRWRKKMYLRRIRWLGSG